MKRNFFFGLIALFLCFGANAADLQKISINNHVFNVEIARTMAELQRGLMFRKSLPADSGMLFIHSTPRILSMWMKNTLIDLDMLFVGEDGKIIGTHTAKAHDLSRINSPYPAKYVLELNAGIVKKLNIKIGDMVDLNN